MKQSSSKVRLDKLLCDRGLVQSRERAKAMILAGTVIVNDTMIDKAGTPVSPESEIRIRGDENPFVSRGGLKLNGALDVFDIDVAGYVALDVGVSTGGFTDCLLQRGVRRVYAVDVGYGQLAWKLRQDDRVILYERTNIRNFNGGLLKERIDFVVIDVSFISLKTVLPVVAELLEYGTLVVALIKPQFEAGKGDVGKKGVVRNPLVHKRVVEEIEVLAVGIGFDVLGTCESSIRGPAGNREFFIYAKKVRNIRT